jgi:hypothetical protein
MVVSESKRVFRIHNPSAEIVKTIQVDGCLITDSRIRCDYAFEIRTISQCIIYLELKGADIEYAFRQLVATMGYLAHRHLGKRKVCHIVASRVPRAGPKVQNLKLEMKKTYDALLYVGTREVRIDVTKAPYV